MGSNQFVCNNDALHQIAVIGVSAAASLVIAKMRLPGGSGVTVGSSLYGIVAAMSPAKVVINQKSYEVRFSYDNQYYTHCYHEILKAYDTGNHKIDTTKMYVQSNGG